MRILIVDDQKTVRTAISQALRAEGLLSDAVESGSAALLKLSEERYDLAILDLHLESEADGLDYIEKMQKLSPGLVVVICTAQGCIGTAVEAMRRGAHDYLEKPFTPDLLRTVLARVQSTRKLKQRTQRLEDQVLHSSPSANFREEDPSMMPVVDVLKKAAPSRATILLLGENGTGKSQMARFVHEHSHCADGPFVTVSCPSLSRELLESELFGHVQGAFTGATKDHWGKVEAARGGTLFLDEVGELPSIIQPKLLRLLQERTYERVGDTKTRTADVRVIAATNRNLSGAVKEGSFREDLFYRLNVIGVTLPPLRERPRALENLAGDFLRFFATESGRPVTGLSDEAWNALRGYSWRGNVRELRNVIERAVILCKTAEIGVSDLPPEITAPSEPLVEIGSLVSMETIERAHINGVLEKTDKFEAAAKVLGVDVATLYRYRKRWKTSEKELATV